MKTPTKFVVVPLSSLCYPEGCMAAVLQPIQEFFRGLRIFPAGLQWLRKNPRYLGYLFLPMFLAIGALVGGLSLFFHNDDWVFTHLFFAKPESWLWLPIYYFGKTVVYLGFMAGFVVFALLLMNVVAAPIYEIVSVAVERQMRGGKVEEISLWKSLLLIGEEIKKAFFILTVSLSLILIPGLNLLGIIVTAFLVGWDFYDYPMARRGWSFRKRLLFVSRDGWAVLGFGLWLMIPFVQMLFFPLAVVGGTLLNLEQLQRSEERHPVKE